MIHEIEFLCKIPFALIALEWLEFLVDMALMLDQIGLLHKWEVALLALEPPFISVRPQVIEEFARTHYNPVAFGVLALEESQLFFGLIMLIKKFEDDEGVGCGLIIRALGLWEIKFWSHRDLQTVFSSSLAVACLDFLKQLLSDGIKSTVENESIFFWLLARLIWDRRHGWKLFDQLTEFTEVHLRVYELSWWLLFNSRLLTTLGLSWTRSCLSWVLSSFGALAVSFN